MRRELPKVFEMESGVERHYVTVALLARDIAMRGFMPITVGLPDFVAARAGTASGVAVVETRAGQKEDDEQSDQ